MRVRHRVALLAKGGKKTVEYTRKTHMNQSLPLPFCKVYSSHTTSFQIAQLLRESDVL